MPFAPLLAPCSAPPEAFLTFPRSPCLRVTLGLSPFRETRRLAVTALEENLPQLPGPGFQTALRQSHASPQRTVRKREGSGHVSRGPLLVPCHQSPSWGPDLVGTLECRPQDVPRLCETRLPLALVHVIQTATKCPVRAHPLPLPGRRRVASPAAPHICVSTCCSAGSPCGLRSPVGGPPRKVLHF